MENKETYIVTDIHGCYLTLLNLLEVMGVKPEDTLVNLGDVIDRGPRIKESLDYFKNRPNTVNILGNHEYHFLDYVIKGFGPNNHFMFLQGLKETVEQLKDSIQIYSDFIRTWKRFVIITEPKPYVFCHSTYPWKDSENGIFNELHLWERWYYECPEEYQNYNGPIIIHGHTPTKNPYEKINGKLIAYDLDGGAVYKKNGSCLRGMRLSDNKIFEVQYAD